MKSNELKTGNEDVERREEDGVHPDVELAMAETVGAVDDVVFSALKGIRRYQIIRAPQEKLDEWKRGVDEIVSAIAAQNLLQIKNLMQKDQRVIGDADTVTRLISEEVLDDTDVRLLAIGLFVLREKSPWHKSKSRLKVMKGGKVRMESAFEPDGWSNCYDIAAIVRELAKMYGVEGAIRSEVLPHAYFETESGKVSDPMFGWKRGGLFQTKEKFEAHKKRMGWLRRTGMKK